MTGKNLTIIDSAFLALEQRTMPLHIGMLLLFQPPEGSGKAFVAQIADRLNQSVLAAPPFNLRVERKRGRRMWIEDKDFDLAHHFTHIALPHPGRVRELLSLISRLHAAHLDRAYPLWSWHLIEGLGDGRIALYLKIHHALADGVATMRLLFKAMSPDAAASMGMPPPWELPPPAKPRVPVLPASTTGGVPGLLGSFVAKGLPAIPAFAKELLQTWRDYRAENPAVVTSAQAPRTIFNGAVTASRRFAAQSYAMSRIRALSKALGASTNDVVLAITASALRRYLMDQRALPKAPLVGVVPVSVREDDFSDSGNDIAFAMVNLATDVADPVERLRVIRGCMEYNKSRFRKMTGTQIQAYSVAQLIPGAIAWLNRFNRSRVAVNVVISHVPAPRQAMYWQGCRLDGIYPASLVVDSVALNITLVSRLEAIDFGIVGCRKSLPSMQRLLEGIEQGLVELEAAVAPGAIAADTPKTV